MPDFFVETGVHVSIYDCDSECAIVSVLCWMIGCVHFAYYKRRIAGLTCWSERGSLINKEDNSKKEIGKRLQANVISSWSSPDLL